MQLLAQFITQGPRRGASSPMLLLRRNKADITWGARPTFPEPLCVRLCAAHFLTCHLLWAFTDAQMKAVSSRASFMDLWPAQDSCLAPKHARLGFMPSTYLFEFLNNFWKMTSHCQFAVGPQIMEPVLSTEKGVEAQRSEISYLRSHS